MDTKQRKYRDLIERVKKSYPARNPSDDGKELRLYWCDDCKEINLWTYWQGKGNLDAKIMLVGQDWGCPWDGGSQSTMDEVRKANEGRAYDYLHNNPSPTDANLTRLFNELGYDITQPHSDLFFTNFVLGYRNKGTSGGYKKEWAEHDKGYFKELTDIIQPSVILCLGKSTFEGVLSAFDAKLPCSITDYNDFIESTHNPVPVTLENGDTAHIFALAHCGAMGTLNRNRKKSTDLTNQIEDWRKVIPYLRKENTGMFQNKVIVITGGANGIGKCIAEEFQKNGAHVCVIDRAKGDHYVGDLADKATLEDFAQRVIEKYGRVDVLVNNAPPLFLGIDECTYEQFQQSMAIGVTAPFYLSKLFAPYFAPGSSIINISSSRDRMSQPQSESYTAAKGGISALTHALAVSFAGKVRVNSISPGWIDTAYTVYEGPDAIQQPAGRVGNPLDIANMVLFLASSKAGFITGENICIDGGQTRLMIYHGDNGWTLNP